MKKLVLLALLGFLLSGCFLRPHKADIEQGNVIIPSEVDRLKPGMSDIQVRNIMGTPVIINIFSPYRMDYVYTFKAGYNPMIERRVICLFKGKILQEVITE